MVFHLPYLDTFFEWLAFCAVLHAARLCFQSVAQWTHAWRLGNKLLAKAYRNKTIGVICTTAYLLVCVADVFRHRAPSTTSLLLVSFSWIVMIPWNRAERQITRLTQLESDDARNTVLSVNRDQRRFESLRANMIAASKIQQPQITEDGLRVKRFVRR